MYHSVAKTIAIAVASSILEYCYSVLSNIANKDNANLQPVQTFLTNVVSQSSNVSRSMPLLQPLH